MHRGRALALAALLVVLPATGAQAKPPPVVGGTLQFGACTSPEALSVVPSADTAYVCFGSPSDDLSRLRKAARTDAGGVTLGGYHNAKDSTTHWTFYATVHYGVARSDGTITEYGQFFTRDDVNLRGNYADFAFYGDRTLGSALKFKMGVWFTINYTGGGSFTDTVSGCTFGSYSGDKQLCNVHYLMATSGGYYGGNGWYGHSRLTWWNQQSRNPSTADGSWTLEVSHGPMDCKSRPQRCQFR